MTDGGEQIKRVLYESAVAGEVEIVGERDGEPLFRLTASGQEHVERLIDTAIAKYGDTASEHLAEQLDLPLWMVEDLVALRRNQS